MRDNVHTSELAERINPEPYSTYFQLKNSKPNAVFAAHLFPEYNKYCHTHQKLCQFIPWQQLYADLMWLGSIQYIGENISKTSIEGVGVLLDTLTTLSPYRSYPYAFAELVLPQSKATRSGETAEEKELKARTRTDAIALGQKGEFFLCDSAKLSAISGMTQDEFIDAVYDAEKRKSYENPCRSYELPHYLAFNYFSYLEDSTAAARQYMISAFHSNAPGLTPLMAALVYGRGGEHLKSATLWYDRYLGLRDDGDDISNTEADRALKKAIFEIQLQIITEAEAASAECQKDYTCLQKNGAIKASIEKNLYSTCDAGKNMQNIRCLVLAEGLKGGFITLG